MEGNQLNVRVGQVVGQLREFGDQEDVVSVQWGFCFQEIELLLY